MVLAVMAAAERLPALIKFLRFILMSIFGEVKIGNKLGKSVRVASYPLQLLWMVMVLLSSIELKSQCKLDIHMKSMGTEFNIKAQSSNCDSLQLGVYCESSLAAFNMIFSDYRSDSELSLLMANYVVNEWNEVSPELFEMLVESDGMANLTNGYFDYTVGPIVKFWRRYKRNGAFDRQEFRKAKQSTGFKNVELDSVNGKVLFKRKQMSLDFGGIAKGWIAQRLAEELSALGYSEILIDAGGDVFAMAEEEVFHIALPRAFGEREKSVRMGALVVSGDWYRSITFKGKKRSHIVNPRSGLGSSESRLVWVSHIQGSVADAWASALSVMPVRKARRFIEKYNIAAKVLTDSKNSKKSN